MLTVDHSQAIGGIIGAALSLSKGIGFYAIRNKAAVGIIGVSSVGSASKQ
jgi:hypothetical protein